MKKELLYALAIVLLISVSLGACTSSYVPTPAPPAQAEEEYKQVARRRIVAKQDLEAGALLNEDSVTFKRSSEGAFVGEWELIDGHRVNRALKKNQGVSFDVVDFTS